MIRSSHGTRAGHILAKTILNASYVSSLIANDSPFNYHIFMRSLGSDMSVTARETPPLAFRRADKDVAANSVEYMTGCDSTALLPDHITHTNHATPATSLCLQNTTFRACRNWNATYLLKSCGFFTVLGDFNLQLEIRTLSFCVDCVLVYYFLIVFRRYLRKIALFCSGIQLY